MRTFIALGAITLLLLTCCETLYAGDLRAGVIVTSVHLFGADGYDDGDQSKPYNADQRGAYIAWRGWTFGTYRNSYGQRSRLAAYELPLHTYQAGEISGFAGVVDGYPDKTLYGDKRPWFGIAARYRIGKAWLVPGALGFGIEVQF